MIMNGGTMVVPSIFCGARVSTSTDFVYPLSNYLERFEVYLTFVLIYYNSAIC